MDARTLRVLEYEAVKSRLVALIGSTVGQELAARLRPSVDAAEIQAWQGETSEAKRVLETDPSVPLGGIRDIRAHLRTAARGGLLEPGDLQAACDTLYASRRLRRFLAGQREACPLLAARADELGEFEEIEREVARCLNDKGEVADRASGELAEIRSRMRRLHDALVSRLEAIVRAPENARRIQDPIVTIRGDRYCLSIRSEFRGEFKGIVHDASASGATLFMEPLATVDLNNDYTAARLAEREEIRRILQRLSGMVGGRADEIARSLQALAALDFIFGRARLSLQMDAAEPRLNPEGLVELVAARHPLLSGEVVPIDISVGERFTTLLITGPNTGGKTVTLKTVGLLTLMAQSGLHIPAHAESRLAIFRQIFADIGDEQSIEQSLSTFSSHMTQIVRLMRAARSDSLVLLDEIGAGTDPAEGSALAKAILTELHRRGCRTLATTHSSELKTFAYAVEGIENASVEFDPETLRPTYRVQIGLPGSSNAFAIAERLGLPHAVTEDARSQMGESQTALEQAIREVEETQRRLTQERLAAQALLREAGELKARYEALLADLEGNRQELLRGARRDAERLLEEMRRQAEALIESLREQARATHKPHEAAERIKEARAELRAIEERVAEALPTPEPPPPPQPEPEAPPALTRVIPGQPVFVRALGKRGTVLGPPDEEGQVDVQVGLLRLRVTLEELQPAPEEPSTTPAEIVARKAREVPPEIHLRGLAVDEAVYQLEQYLDDAVVAGLPRVRIIHGFGTGAVRNAALEVLRQHPQVKGYRSGGRGEGGGGVTIAELEPA